MEVKSLHHVITHWYNFMPKLTAVQLTGMPSGSAPSDGKERKLDLKITLDLAMERLLTTDDVRLSNEELESLQLEGNKKFPIKKATITHTACPHIGRLTGETAVEKNEDRRKEQERDFKQKVSLRHYQVVKAVMNQSARKGEPMSDDHIWAYLQWEAGFVTPQDAAKVYWDALCRLSRAIKSIERDHSKADPDCLPVDKLVDRLCSTNDPDLQVSTRTVHNYVQRGILRRQQLEHAGANGGPPVWVYDFSESTSRLKFLAECKSKHLSLDEIAELLSK